MLGAIIGDIVGSQFDFIDHYGKDFELFTPACKFTDDTLMTLAVANALYLSKGDYAKLGETATKCMVDIAHRYPSVGWGMRFHRWLFERQYKMDSYGNGSGMRISPVGWVADSEEEVKILSKKVTEISHGHKEGLKGAEAIAMAVYWARIGKDKQFIKQRLIDYYPKLKDKTFTINNIIGHYGYDDMGDWVTCQGSVPHSLVAFLEGNSFEDVIRNAVGMGGDSDTIGAMAGAIAEAYYGLSYEWEEKALAYLPDDLKGYYFAFENIKRSRQARL